MAFYWTKDFGTMENTIDKRYIIYDKTIYINILKYSVKSLVQQNADRIKAFHDKNLWF